MISVLLVDDHPLVTDGLRSAINAEDDLGVVGVARDLAEARRLLDALRPDVAVVDVRLPDGSGFDLVDPLRRTRWLMLSSFGTVQYVEATKAAGATGFWLKSSTPDRIIKAIRLVADDALAFDPDLTARPSAAPSWHRLTARERDVIRLAISGASNDEIGKELGIARKTVEAHLTRLLERMGCTSKTDLAARAVEEGWLYLPHR